ncbi:MAG: ribosome biogenesis GTP-binding protein YihA/YsxC [Thermoanaerobaculia bacterium]
MDIRSVAFARAVHRHADLPKDRRPQVAIVGRSNVGKSTLINALLGRKKGVARVSQTPGKTQAIHFYLVNDRFYLVDLPGYGYARVPREVSRAWGDLVGGYLESAQELRMLLLLLDARRIPSDEDLQIRDWMEARQRPWRVVLTKVDKLSGNDLAKSRRAVAESLGLDRDDLIAFSARDRRGVPPIWSAIDTAVAEARTKE